MALLYRFTRLNDRANTGVFTFIVTRSVTRDLHRDATTKDFVYGYHRWAISFCRTEKLLGVMLILRNPSANSKVHVDFSFTLVSREHFSKNEHFAEKQCKFSAEQPSHGTTKLIAMAELRARRFSDENSEFVLELSLSHVKAIFETDVKAVHSGVGTHVKLNKMETTSFMFGGLEWNASIVPSGTTDNGATDNGRTKILLNRLTGFDHYCRVQYKIVLGDGDKKIDSGVLDQISDLNGRIRGFLVKGTVAEMVKKGSLHVHLEMLCANVTSEVRVSTAAPRDPNASPNCYDRDKQGWSVEADAESEHLKVKVFYSDIGTVPRNHLRFVSWNAYVVRTHPTTGYRESVLVLDAPHCNYYVQDGVDMGVVMDTDISSKQLKETPNAYFETGGELTVHVEWLDCLLLFSALYHKYDDLCKVHGHQMKREIAALQAENYTLEKQLTNYQKTLARCPEVLPKCPDVLSRCHNPDHYYSRTLSENQSFSESEYA